MDICDPYPPRTHLWAERLKQVRRRYASTPLVVSGSCRGSDEGRRGCSDHQRQTGRDDRGLSESGQSMRNSGPAHGFTYPQRACTSLSAIAYGLERLDLGKPM